ncbi:putative penicillin-binding protein PbpX, partial [Pseudocercospora fuligena]
HFNHVLSPFCSTMRATKTAIVLAVALSSKALSTKPLLDQSFDSQAEELLKLLNVPGLSVAIVHGNESESKGYGYARIPSAPATADTLYYAGSTTKAFTATLAAMMVENKTHFKDVGWSTPLSSLLEGDFALSKEYESLHTTLEDALSHRSGLPRHDIACGWGNASTFENIRRMRYLPMTAEPRTRWQYCNTMFGAVGGMIERHAGASPESVFRNRIWEPLGMKSTGFTKVDDDRVARGYFWQGEHYVPEKFTDISGIAGAGATISSVNDYSLWMRALLDAYKGKINPSSPITSSLWTEITRSRSVINVEDLEPLTYALGWLIGRLGKHTVVTHDGGVNGYGTTLFLMPDLDFGFVSMGNTQSTAAIAGAALFSSLLRKLSPYDQMEINEAKVRGMHEFLSSRKAFAGLRKSDDADNISLPLPGNVQDYAGLYEHPAYGILNISLVSPEHASRAEIGSQQPLSGTKQIQFSVKPSARLWAIAGTLKHKSHTSFDFDIFSVSGPIEEGRVDKECGRVENAGRVLICKNEEAHDMAGTTSAAFELSIDGNGVTKLGLQFEPEQIRRAGEVGGNANWRESMIWFTK